MKPLLCIYIALSLALKISLQSRISYLICVALSSGHFFNLILCGHTHGGQYFPYNLLLWLGNPFFRFERRNRCTDACKYESKYAQWLIFFVTRGLYTKLGPAADSQVYVTEGTVFWGMPFRLGSTMEISKIVLKN